MTQTVDFQNVQVAPAGMPHNAQAEEAVLGAILLSPDVFHEVAAELPYGAEEFYVHRNRWVWEALERLVAQNMPIDLLTVMSQIEADGTVGDVGGFARLTALVASVGTTTNATAHAKLVHEKTVRRKMIEAANTTAQLAYDEQTPLAEVASTANRALSTATAMPNRNSMNFADALVVVDRIVEENGRSPDLPGIPTPWADYNRLLGGGAQRSDANLVIGRPGKGKTSFLLQVAAHAARYGEGLRVKRNHVVFFSLEMPVEQLTLRLLSQMSGIDVQTIRSGKFNEAQYAKYLKTVEDNADLDIHIEYMPAASPEQIRSKCEMYASAGMLDMVVVDSLNLMTAPGWKGRDYALADYCATGLKNIAGIFNVPLWAAHQQNRGMDARGDDARPKLSDMRDGGEQPVDGAMFIWHQTENGQIVQSWFVQEKHRNGPTGDVPIVFRAEVSRFENAARL